MSFALWSVHRYFPQRGRKLLSVLIAAKRAGRVYEAANLIAILIFVCQEAL
jgi:hypothetical protein